MEQAHTTGHYDEIARIDRFRTTQLRTLDERLQRQRGNQALVRNQSYPNQANVLRKTTVRKAPAGRH